MVYPMFAITQGVTEHAPLCELETAEKVSRLIVSFICLRLRDATNFLSSNCLYEECSE